MAKQEFTLEALKDFDNGEVWIALAEEIRTVVADCQTRPSVGDARKVSLTIEVKPIPSNDRSQCLEVALSFSMKNTTPARKSRTYILDHQKGGKLVYSVNNPTDHKQGHIDDEIDRNKGK